MKLVVLKVNVDIINGGAMSVRVGVFEDSGGQPLMEFVAPRENLVQTKTDLKAGQELKLISVEAIK